MFEFLFAEKFELDHDGYEISVLFLNRYSKDAMSEYDSNIWIVGTRCK